MNHLAEIVARKRQRVAAAKELASHEAIELAARQVRQAAQSHAFGAALREPNRINVIGEFKRRSPSKGVIRIDANPGTIAQDYERGGAAAISVLTEEDFFAGSLNDLRAVRQVTSLPILRKDFIFEEYQVFESAAAGADAILLIVASLDDDALRRLRALAEEDLNMDALVEVHDREESERAIGSGASLIGVNNRNLATFEVSLETSIELAAHVRSGALLVSESGIETADDIKRLRDAGYQAFLIGESLMRADDPRAALSELTQSGGHAKAETVT